MSARIPKKRPRATGIVSHSYLLVHNQLLSECRRLAERSIPTDELARSIDASAFAAIILSATVVEIAANDAIESLLGSRARANDQWRLVYDHVTEDRWTPLEKSRMLFEDLKGKAVKWGEEPWESIEDLRVLRNELVHYESRPVSGTVEGHYFPERSRNRLKDRARKLNVLGLFEDKEATWLNVFLNRPVAMWSADTAKSAVDSFDALTFGREQGK